MTDQLDPTPTAGAPMRFADMEHVHPHTAIALERAGLTEPFPIQTIVVPKAAAAGDLLVKSPTGSGKTLAFGLGIIHQLPRGGDTPRALILVPTRELAAQVSQDLVPIAWARQIRCAPVFGGAGINRQVKLAARAPIVVATPGRLADLVRDGKISLQQVEILVLDEADRMLDMGFQPQVDVIARSLYSLRQTMLFSATLNGPVRKLASAYTRSPETIENVAAPGAGGSIDHVMLATTPGDRVTTLLTALDDPARDLALVFVATQRMAEGLKQHLRTFGLRTTAIHGGMRQNERLREYRHFKAGTCDVLIATDIFSRGMDLTRITHVINYDLPEDADAYRHRTGRTGRAGRSGTAITLIEPGQRAKMQQITRDIGLPGDLLKLLTQPALRHFEPVPEAARYVDPPDERSERFASRGLQGASDAAATSDPVFDRHTGRVTEHRPIDFDRKRKTGASDRPVTSRDALAESGARHGRGNGAPIEGIITSYNDAKGFGFIKPRAGGKQVFFHRRSVIGRKDVLVRSNSTVTFKLAARTEKGDRAESVHVTGLAEKLRRQ